MRFRVAAYLNGIARLSFYLLLFLTPWAKHWVIIEHPVDDIYYEFTNGVLYLTDIPLVITLLSWIGARFSGSRGVLRWGPWQVTAPLGLLVALSLLGAPLALDPFLAYYLTLRLVLLSGLYLFAVNEVTPSRVAATLVVAVGVQSAVALGQFLAQSSLGLARWGELTLDPDWSGVSVVQAAGRRWLRAYGFSPHPNILGGVLAVWLLTLTRPFLQAGKRQSLWLIFAGLGVTALLATFSRLAWLGFLAGAALMVVAVLMKRNWREGQGLSFLKLGAVVLAASFLFGLSYQELFAVRLLRSPDPLEQRAVVERLNLQAAAVDMTRAYPLTGVGSHGFSVAAYRMWGRDTAKFTYQPVHNMLLLLTAELGPLGGGTWLWLVLVPWLLVWRQYRAGRLTLWSLALSAGVLGLFVISFLDFYPWGWQQGRLLLWITPGVVEQQPGKQVTDRRWQKGAIGYWLSAIGHWPSGEVRQLAGPGLAFLMFVLPFVVYLRTLAPTVYGLDSAELATAAYTLGLLRSPGYPLYLLVGKLFTYLPWGDVGYRMNLMSAVFGAMTVVLLYRIVYHLVGRPLIAATVALFFAFTYYFWAASVVAEVYTLYAFLMACLILLLLAWSRTGDSRLLYAVAFIYGLSFSNTPVAALLAPGLAFFTLATDRRQVLKPGNILTIALFFALGLSVYLYFPLRYLADPPFNYVGQYDGTGHFWKVNLTSWSGLWWLISGGPFTDLMFSYSLPEVGLESLRYVYQLWGNFLAIGLAFGLLGLIISFRENRKTCLFLSLLFLTHGTFFINYRVVDKQTMFLPTFLSWAIWIGWGYKAVLEGVAERKAGAGGAILGGRWSQGVAVLLVAIVVMTFFLNFHYVDVSDDWRARALAEALLAEVQPGALVFGSWASAAPLHYLQLVEGQRPDVTVVNRFFIDHRDLEEWIQREIDTRPIYSAEYDPGLADKYSFVRLGQAYRLVHRPSNSE